MQFKSIFNPEDITSGGVEPVGKRKLFRWESDGVNVSSNPDLAITLYECPEDTLAIVEVTRLNSAGTSSSYQTSLYVDDPYVRSGNSGVAGNASYRMEGNFHGNPNIVGESVSEHTNNHPVLVSHGGYFGGGTGNTYYPRFLRLSPGQRIKVWCNGTTNQWRNIAEIAVWEEEIENGA